MSKESVQSTEVVDRYRIYTRIDGERLDKCLRTFAVDTTEKNVPTMTLKVSP